MADWKFADAYPQYPGLPGSVLGFLQFTTHAFTGIAFTGTLDLTTPPGLAVFAQLAGVSSLALTGTVTDAGDTLTVNLTSTTDITAGLKQLPLIGPALVGGAVSVRLVTKKSDDPDGEPATNAFTLSVTFKVASGSITLTGQVPLGDGLATLTGTTSGLGVALSDLDFLVVGGGNWFPAKQLGPYAAGGPKLELVKVSLSVYVTVEPAFSVKPASVTVEVGITNIPLLSNRLYLNPLAVAVTVTGEPDSPVKVGVVGDLAVCNYARPGDTGKPDAVLDVQLGLTDFSLLAELEVPEGETGLAVGTLVSDLMGAKTDIGLPDTLTITTFHLNTQADTKTGKIDSFSTEIAMSGGFGLFTDFDLESFDLKLDYGA